MPSSDHKTLSLPTQREFSYAWYLLQGRPLNPLTKRRGGVVGTDTSYLGSPEFDIRPRRQAVLTVVFRGFPDSLQANAGIVP